MEENTKENLEATEKVETVEEIDYNAMKTVMDNTVSKKDYQELLEKYKNVMQDFANGKSPETKEEEKPVDLDKLREKIFSQEVNNLEYAQAALALRNELIKRGEKDPFLPVGKNITPTYDDVQAAGRVADVLQQCIDYAEGDSILFTQELQRKTNDVRIRR